MLRHDSLLVIMWKHGGSLCHTVSAHAATVQSFPICGTGCFFLGQNGIGMSGSRNRDRIGVTANKAGLLYQAVLRAACFFNNRSFAVGMFSLRYLIRMEFRLTCFTEISRIAVFCTGRFHGLYKSALNVPECRQNGFEDRLAAVDAYRCFASVRRAGCRNDLTVCRTMLFIDSLGIDIGLGRSRYKVGMSVTGRLYEGI